MDWFLYDNGLRHERVKIFYKRSYTIMINLMMKLSISTYSSNKTKKPIIIQLHQKQIPSSRTLEIPLQYIDTKPCFDFVICAH